MNSNTVLTSTSDATVMLYDPKESEGRSLSFILGDGGLHVRQVTSEKNAVKLLRDEDIDVAVIRIHKDSDEAQKIASKFRQVSPMTEVVVTMDDSSIDITSMLSQTGIYDCIGKQSSDSELIHRVKQAVKHKSLRRELTHLREHVAMNFGFDNLVGISQKMIKLKQTVIQVSPTDIPIMISGAPGTGRTLISSIIHHHSNRRKARLIRVDCSTQPELLSAQLFGDSTLIATDSPLLAQADGGTLLLQSVDSLNSEMQNQLVQFLKSFKLSGTADTAEKRLDIRILSTVNDDIENSVLQNKFSSELFRLLGVINIQVPELAQRVDDIEILAEYFLRKMSANTGKPALSISRSALERLLRHRWPGNVRELESLLHRANALCQTDRLQVEDIVFLGSTGTVESTHTEIQSPRLPRTRIADNQRQLIEQALHDNNWNFTQTAQELGIGRTTLWRKVKKYNLQRDKSDEQAG